MPPFCFTIVCSLITSGLLSLIMAIILIIFCVLRKKQTQALSCCKFNNSMLIKVYEAFYDYPLYCVAEEDIKLKQCEAYEVVTIKRDTIHCYHN